MTPLDSPQMSSPATPDFQAILGRFERPLIQYAHSFVTDLDGARDIVQEVFITYVRAMMKETTDGAGRPPTEGQHLEGWLFTVTRYRSLDHVRKQQRLVPMPFMPAEEPSTEPCPAEQAEKRDDAAWLLSLVDRLPPNQREVIRLKFQSDLSYEEISSVTGLSVGNVGFLLHHGLKALKAMATRLEKEKSERKGAVR